MKWHHLFVCAMVGLMMTACQSHSFRIEGTAKGLHDGDTVWLSRNFEAAAPSDTLIVSGGKFVLEGTTDSISIAQVFALADSTSFYSSVFFIEPGTIHITFTNKEMIGKVGGTETNDRLQKLTDTLKSIEDKITAITQNTGKELKAPSGNPQTEMRREQLMRKYAETLRKAALNNADNELGYLLLLTSSEEMINNKQRMEIISKMPAKMRKRPAIHEMEAHIKGLETLADFTMNDVNGKPQSVLAEAKKHKLTIIDFWASWCGPCRQDAPELVKLYNTYKSKGLGIIGISLDQDKAAWQQAISELHLSWMHLSDLRGWDNKAARMLGINSIPHTIVIDNQGKVLGQGLRSEALADLVAKNLQ